MEIEEMKRNADATLAKQKTKTPQEEAAERAAEEKAAKAAQDAAQLVRDVIGKASALHRAAKQAGLPDVLVAAVLVSDAIRETGKKG